MISKDKINEYEKYQLKQVELVADKIKKNGKIGSAAEFYPDIQLKKSVGYTRGEVPLKAMMLLYEQVVVKLPVFKTEKQLVNFLGMTLDEFVFAVQKKSIIPIIGKLEDFKYDHYERILDLDCPALFTRGVSLLNHAHLETVLDEGKKIIRDKGISSDSSVQKIYENKQKSKGIKQTVEDDLSILYADLCLFGHQQSVEEIFFDSAPFEMYKNLATINELFTYPILFGLGGTANFESKKAAKCSISLNVDFTGKPNTDYMIISHNLDNLLSFFDLATTNYTVQEIVAFQQKGGCKKLLSAMDNLSKVVKKKMHSVECSTRSEELMCLEGLDDAIRDLYKTLDKDILAHIDKQSKIVKIGAGALSLGAGAATAVLSLSLGPVIAALGTVAVTLGTYFSPKAISWLTGDKVTDIVNRAIISKRFSPTVSSIWSAKKIMDKVKKHE